jgi:hypothetical protein
LFLTFACFEIFFLSFLFIGHGVESRTSQTSSRSLKINFAKNIKIDDYVEERQSKLFESFGRNKLFVRK